MIGQIISHYKILEKLGEGGMGVVYKAQDTKLDRFVALKFLPPHLAADEQDKKRFIHEAKAASALDHPNICTIHEIDETPTGELFIAMALYEGKSLNKKIEQAPLTIEEALNIAIQTAEGLQAAHEKGITHRDTKSSNIMIIEKGRAVIMDFGLARTAGATKLTKTGATIGTVPYMSPEQARGEKVDHRTDIWSLGVVLYEMITGQLPFKSEYQEAIVYSILNQDPEPVTSLRSGVPMELERIVIKCLEKNPASRYQHADELLVDLRQLQQTNVDTAKSEKIPEIQRKTRRPKKSLIVISMVAGAVLVVAVILVLRSFLAPRDESNTTSDTSMWENSIAVLPFKNISADPEQEYFCDGITEQIITNLTQLEKLKVTARSSVMKFKQSDKTVPEIGIILNVNYVLEGSVRKSGNQIRVTAQLIKAADGFHLWAKDYDRTLKEIFEVQDNISQEIASTLMQKLSHSEINEVRTVRSAAPDAYLYYLQGLYLANRFDHVPAVETFRNAETMLKKCIGLDAEFAPAYAELSYLYGTFRFYSATTVEERALYLKYQEDASKKAIELEPDLPEALLGKARMHWARNERGELYKTTKQLLLRSPNHVRGNLLMGYTLRNHGLVYESIPYFDVVTRLDPIEPWSYTARGMAHTMLGKLDSAFLEYEKALRLEPNDSETLSFYISGLLQSKRAEEAERLLVRFKTLRSDDRVARYESWLLALKGQAKEAVQRLETIPDDKFARMTLDILLGNTQNAITYLVEQQKKEALDNSISRYLYLKNLILYNPLRSDFQFQYVVEQERQKYALVLTHYGYEK